MQPAPSTLPRPTRAPFGDDAPAADEAVVLDDHRRRLGRLEHATDADAAREVHVRADLRARSDRRPRVDHRVVPDVRADVHVARHQHDAPLEERAVARRMRRARRARPSFLKPDFSGSLSAYSNGPSSTVLIFDSRKSSKIACFSHEWTTTAAGRRPRRREPGRCRGGRRPREPDAAEDLSPGSTSLRRSHSSSICPWRSAMRAG